MADRPPLTDYAALRRNRARSDPARGLFLQNLAADDITNRLPFINRHFAAPAVVSPFPGVWRSRLAEATIVADSDVLDLRTGRHDLVIHALCLHWANDPVGQLIQCRRALQPDGLLLGVSFGGKTLSELRHCLVQAESAISGGLAARIAPMADLRAMGALLQRAGFALPVVDSLSLRVLYDSAWHLMKDLRTMGETNALHARLRRPTPRAVLNRAAAIYARQFATQQQKIPATFELLFIAGWAPHESQPRPLRPGSALGRRADMAGQRSTASKHHKPA